MSVAMFKRRSNSHIITTFIVFFMCMHMNIKTTFMKNNSKIIFQTLNSLCAQNHVSVSTSLCVAICAQLVPQFMHHFMQNFTHHFLKFLKTGLVDHIGVFQIPVIINVTGQPIHGLVFCLQMLLWTLVFYQFDNH